MVTWAAHCNRARRDHGPGQLGEEGRKGSGRGAGLPGAEAGTRCAGPWAKGWWPRHCALCPHTATTSKASGTAHPQPQG